MKRILTIMVLLVTLLFVVSCAKEVETVNEEHNIPEELPVIKNEIKEVPLGDTYQVVIQNNQFNPTDLDIKVGDVVEWVNNDEERHTVSSETGMFDDYLISGATYSYQFKEEGEFRYFCSLVPEMQGQVIVS